MQALRCCEIQQQLDALWSQEWISREVGLIWWLKERSRRATPPDQQEPPTWG